MPARLDIDVYVGGQEQIDALTARLIKLKEQTTNMNDVKKKVALQYRSETELLKQNNKVLQAKSKMTQGDIGQRAKQLNLEEDFSNKYEHRINVERKALRLQEEAKAKGEKLTKKEARIRAQDQFAFEEEQGRKQKSLKATRQALMQASISMFVLNISANQMLSSLKPLVKGNEEYSKALEGMQATLNMSLGPMQFFMAMQGMMINMSEKQQRAVGGLVGGMGALYFIYAMITTKAKELKIIFGALAGVAVALTIKSIAQTKANWANAISWATVKAVFGDYSGFVKLAFGLATAGAVMGVVASMLSFQTLPGRTKIARNSQIAQLHSGEEVRRPILADRAKGGESGLTMNMYFDKSTKKSDATAIAQTVRDVINQGSMRKRTRAISTGV